MGKCGNICVEIWGTFAQNLATNFVGQYSAKIIEPFYPTILKQDQKAIACVLPTVGLGRCGKMLEKLERCGDRLQIKPYEQVRKSIIINRKLPFSAHYFEVTNKKHYPAFY